MSTKADQAQAQKDTYKSLCADVAMMGTFIVTVTLPRLRFHDLRHSFASLLIAAGVELVKVSVLFGHSELRVTADLYSHLQQQTFAGCQTGCQLCSQRPGIPADPGSLSAPL